MGSSEGKCFTLERRNEVLMNTAPVYPCPFLRQAAYGRRRFGDQHDGEYCSLVHDRYPDGTTVCYIRAGALF